MESNSALQEVLLRYSSRKPWGRVPSLQDWSQLQDRIGHTLPDDFKEIVVHTGGCPMGNCCLLNPAERDNVFISLSHEALLRMHLQIGDIARERVGVDLYPEPWGLVTLARVDSSYFCMSPSTDTIVLLDLFGDGAIETGMGFAELMLTLFADREILDELGQSIWGDEPFFSTMPGPHC